MDAIRNVLSSVGVSNVSTDGKSKIDKRSSSFSFSSSASLSSIIKNAIKPESKVDYYNSKISNLEEKLKKEEDPIKQGKILTEISKCEYGRSTHLRTKIIQQHTKIEKMEKNLKAMIGNGNNSVKSSEIEKLKEKLSRYESKREDTIRAFASTAFDSKIKRDLDSLHSGISPIGKLYIDIVVKKDLKSGSTDSLDKLDSKRLNDEAKDLITAVKEGIASDYMEMKASVEKKFENGNTEGLNNLRSEDKVAIVIKHMKENPESMLGYEELSPPEKEKVMIGVHS